MTVRAPTLADVLRKAVDSGAARLRVSLPGRILSFDAATQTARVQPLLKESYLDEAEERQVEGLPAIEDVPVQFMGGGDYVLTVPVVVGDPCWLVFSDRALDVWQSSGAEVDPVDERRHHLSDAVAILGVRSSAKAIASFDTSGVRMGRVGDVGVVARTGAVHLGVTENQFATEAGVLGTAMLSYLNTLYNFTVAVNTAVGTSTPVPTVPAAPTVSMLSTKVKIK